MQKYPTVEKACVNQRGQLVIPAKLRQRYGITSGTKVCFIERKNEILIQPITKQYIRSLCGSLKSKTSVTGALIKERASEKKGESHGR